MCIYIYIRHTTVQLYFLYFSNMFSILVPGRFPTFVLFRSYFLGPGLCPESPSQVQEACGKTIRRLPIFFKTRQSYGKKQKLQSIEFIFMSRNIWTSVSWTFRGPIPVWTFRAEDHMWHIPSLAFRYFLFSIFYLWASISALGPENKTPRRKFYGESDVQVKNIQLRRPEVKIKKHDPTVAEKAMHKTLRWHHGAHTWGWESES